MTRKELLKRHEFDFISESSATKFGTDMAGNLCCIVINDDVKVYGIGSHRKRFEEEAEQIRSELHDCE